MSDTEGSVYTPTITPIRERKIGTTLRYLREDLGLTMGDLADHFSITVAEVSDVERSIVDMPARWPGSRNGRAWQIAWVQGIVDCARWKASR